MVVRRFVLVALAAAALLMLGTGGGTAAEVIPTDGITPDPVSVTLGKGSSTTVDSSLHLTQLPARADILLALDTTGSMQLAIDNAKADANELVNNIHAQIPGARFAVASFKDYPISPFGSTGDYPWRLDRDFTTNEGTIDCPIGVDTTQLSPTACALNGLSAGGGNDAPEAYNRAFYEADRLSWAPNAPRFMIVLGDQLPHDTQINTTFPACPNTAQNDPGPDGTPGTSDDLQTKTVLDALKAHHTNVSFVTYNATATSIACHTQMAEYTGGRETVHGATDSLKAQIVDLITQAASHVDSVTFNVVGPETSLKPTLSFSPPTLGPATAPADLSYVLTIRP